MEAKPFSSKRTENVNHLLEQIFDYFIYSFSETKIAHSDLENWQKMILVHKYVGTIITPWKPWGANAYIFIL